MANPSKVLGTVREIEALGEGVYVVTFEVPNRYTKFFPGQFLHLTLDDFDPTSGYWPESRVFSIASKPKSNHVTIVYSVKGVFTRKMEKELLVGRKVWLKFPYGEFIINETLFAQGPLVLIAGGTGISPYWPFLMSRTESTGQVHLFYGVRSQDHILFKSELKTLGSASWFKLHLYVEDGLSNEFASEKGRLSIGGIEKTLKKDFFTGIYFLSGPPAMIRSFKNELLALGVVPTKIYIDEWE